MIAIYARQSVDRPDSISIESQIEFCLFEARGEAYRLYTDRGYSGKNTERPAFRQMMADIASGQIQRVIVYKLDRISRSIVDFSLMMEKFGVCGVDFISASEKFDTGSPMGRAMLNICIVFAQLERETIQKRVADAYASRSRKSLYMGGRIPFGFRLEPALVGDTKTAAYVPWPEEAALVQRIYQLYAQPQTSYGDVVRYLTEQKLGPVGKNWTRGRIADMIRNPVYVQADEAVYDFFAEKGVQIVNPPEDFIGVNGCYYYRDPQNSGDKYREMAGNHLVLAPHQGLIPPELWLICRKKACPDQMAGLAQKAKNTWLAGKIKCGCCGYALLDKQNRRGGSRYLQCSGRMENHQCPGCGTLHTEDLEALLTRELQKVLSSRPLLLPEQQAADPACVNLRLNLSRLERDMAALADQLPQAGASLLQLIEERVCRLSGERQRLFAALTALENRSRQAASVACLPELWPQFSFEEKRQVLDLLVSRIWVAQERIIIEWRY